MTITKHSTDALAEDIIENAIKVHEALGPGLLERIYRDALFMELKNSGLIAIRDVVCPILYKGNKLDIKLRMDLIVENCLIVEVRCFDNFSTIHRSQMLTYLRIKKLKFGLVLNFNKSTMQEGIMKIDLNSVNPNGIIPQSTFQALST
ncbi:MAG: GxxExxY protein [Ignavibacteriaceae bacterium]|jgi:hypothetical protein|nr:MAG: GxxExxY protein [Chlorobiota bacterium]KXK02268.1 MAG: GTP-binding signal recognition particle [Chlorobi bacterium OLB4]MBV6399695.1 hypothetical protein [Ignavibacteria bacterium]MCC6885618.1 GxxExxY protein [Ignavibacteriales bacterium]MCE7954002.1 GxxExxY protein [Chlorobi bacterium CHB7]MDL1887901.1 GxxExxY protein [Ignavibacteria bacterium CHB1]MEB2330566.1 GxxExxY protein [Ignavibacteriaceae bacterium]OQY78790.1 MAG: hypothetical protein B6D43_01400 [Ignavibacteriales bacterium